jgi:hypothetical protein
LIARSCVRRAAVSPGEFRNPVRPNHKGQAIEEYLPHLQFGMDAASRRPARIVAAISAGKSKPGG